MIHKPLPDNIRVILLSGEDFQRLERLAEIIDYTLDDSTRDFNLDVFTPETFVPETVSELIMTYPMMAEKRVVVLRDFDKLDSDTGKKASEIIKNTPETSRVIIEGEKATLSPKPPARLFRSEKFKPIYENRLPSWIQARFAKRGKKAATEAVALLINNVGNVLGELDNEIEKITVASHDKQLITEQDVSQVVGMFRHDTIWNLCNAVGLGDFDSAARILTNLVESEKNRETFYVATLASHIMKIAQYNSLIQKGVPHAEAMKVVTESPFLWKLNRMGSQVGNFGTPEVRSTLTKLARTESMLKRFSVDKRLVMELLIPFLTPEQVKTGKT